MSDTVGWRWSQKICGLGFSVLLLLFLFSFEETLFPRFLFSQQEVPPVESLSDTEAPRLEARKTETSGSKGGAETGIRPSRSGVSIDEFPRRTYLNTLKPWVRYPQNKTTFWQYFRRPFFLWGFPNIVIVSCPARCPFPQTGVNNIRRRDSSTPSERRPVSFHLTPYPRS